MDLKTVESIVNSEMVFAILFIFGLVFISKWFFNYMAEQKAENTDREEQLMNIYKEQIKEGSLRERELMSHLSKNTEQLKNIADTLEGVQGNLEKLEGRVNQDLQNVWKELGGKVDKGRETGGDIQ